MMPIGRQPSMQHVPMNSMLSIRVCHLNHHVHANRLVPILDVVRNECPIRCQHAEVYANESNQVNHLPINLDVVGNRLLAP